MENQNQKPKGAYAFRSSRHFLPLGSKARLCWKYKAKNPCCQYVEDADVHHEKPYDILVSKPAGTEYASYNR